MVYLAHKNLAFFIDEYSRAVGVAIAYTILCPHTYNSV